LLMRGALRRGEPPEAVCGRVGLRVGGASPAVVVRLGEWAALLRLASTALAGVPGDPTLLCLLGGAGRTLGVCRSPGLSVSRLRSALSLTISRAWVRK
jgi:hypothetical protein